MMEGRGFPAPRHRIASARRGMESMGTEDIWKVWMCKKAEGTTNPKSSRQPINFFLASIVRYETYY
jgi:hypothetical protein